MKIVLKAFLLLIMAMAVRHSTAAADCPTIPTESIYEYEIRAATANVNCLFLSGSENLSSVSVTVIYSEPVPYSLRILQFSNGTLNPVSVHPGDTDGFAITEVTPAGRRLALSVAPNQADGLHRNIRVLYMVVANAGYVVYRVDTVSPSGATEVPPDPNGQYGCNPTTNVCYNEPRGTPKATPSTTGKRMELITQGTPQTATTSPPQCGSTNTPPPQLNRGEGKTFDLNKALEKYKKLGAAIDAAALPPRRQAVKGAILTTDFAPRMKHDLKNNPQYQTHEAYGNFFFGAAVAAIGLDVDTAVKAGAAVQQAQNIVDPTLPDRFLNIPALTVGVYNAVVSGIGDNDGDSQQITNGHNYETTVRQFDAAGANGGNSCDRTTPPPTPPFEGGVNGGYTYGNLWLENVNIRICYGRCTVTPSVGVVCAPIGPNAICISTH